MRFKAASFNINSIRARKELLLNWLLQTKPDVLCLQETKVMDKDFPVEDFDKIGYNVLFKGQKSYNGVAILSPHPLKQIDSELGDAAEPGEARLLTALVKGIYVVNTYIPQGQNAKSPKFTFKLNWIKAMRDYFARNFTPEQSVLWLGDFNVAPEPIDIHDPKRLLGHVGYHPEEHKVLAYVKEWGFQDVFRKHKPEGGHYTFWDYRVPRGVERNLGWRVDHIWGTAAIADCSVDSWVDLEPRKLEKPSDHTFIMAEFDLPLETV